MFKIEVSDRIKNACPQFAGVAILAVVTNASYSEELWTEINDSIRKYKEKNTLEDLKKNRAILATREAYKKLGKDEEKYVESFERIAVQYTDEQLKLIITFLPKNVTYVLENNSPKYRQVMGMNPKTIRKENKKFSVKNEEAQKIVNILIIMHVKTITIPPKTGVLSKFLDFCANL